jgi:hypothetical protein
MGYILYANDDSLLGENINTEQENAETLLDTRKEEHL